MLPNFLIIGAMKAGTSTLKYWLSQHPNIYMYPNELNFFTPKKYSHFNNYHQNGLDWYQDKFSDAKAHQLIGEKSPSYHYTTESPKLIKQTLEDVKLLFILRNPIDRAWSNYWHKVRYGAELLSFEEVINHELKGKSKFTYLKRGFYYDQIQNYLKYFDRNQLKIIIFEEMIKNPQKILDDVFRFLDVEKYKVDKIQLEKKNVTKVPISPRVQYMIKETFGHGSLIEKLVRRINSNLLGHKRPKLKKELRLILQERFEPKNEQLSRLLDIDVSKKWTE